MLFGTDAGVYPHGDNGKQFAKMVQWGMSPIQAIRAATTSASEALGRPEVGSLQPGAFGDIIAVRGDPLANIAVLVDRARTDKTADPLEPLLKLLAAGESLILFPEGTRGMSALPGPFKSGLFRLAQAMPAVELIPVYLENLHRSLPRGALLPIPLTCTVRFGAPLAAVAGETKDAFLERARSEVINLSGMSQ